MSRLRTAFILFALVCLPFSQAATQFAKAGDSGNSIEIFQRVWDRTDLPVDEGVEARTWMWGSTVSEVISEPYAEGPGSEGTSPREVQYFDKSRMEITNPDGDPELIWYVTNGLLAVELITGEMQVGDDEFVPRFPSEIPVAGDNIPRNGPSYATFQLLHDPVDDRGDAVITEHLDWEGNAASVPDLEAFSVHSAYYDDVTGHNIAGPFWEFMNSSGAIWENGAFVEGLLFPNPFYATGRPITEPYWADVTVAGTEKLVLLQCFERRCLTYTPGNPAGWQVEAGNVGQHYYQWRYARRSEPGELLFEDDYYSNEAGRIVSDIFIVQADGSGATNLTNNPAGDDYNPVWSPDGSRFAFFRNNEPSARDTGDLYLMTSEDGGVDLIAEAVNALAPATWSPDGSKLAFTRVSDLVILDLISRSETVFDSLPGLVEGSPSWSPDGQQLAIYYVPEDQIGNPPPMPFTIATLRVDGSDLTEVATSSGLPRKGAQPIWSPNGQHIAFFSVDYYLDDQLLRQQVSKLNVVERDTGDVFSTAAISVSWSPDSTEIAYWNPGGGIYVSEPDGAHKRQIVDDGGGEVAWSPDGLQIAYSGLYLISSAGADLTQINEDGRLPAWRPQEAGTLLFEQNGELFTVTADGTLEQHLTAELSLFASDAEWSPDGQHIAFVGSTDKLQAEPGVLFVMNADGTGRTQITDGPYDSAPSWSSDGTRIAFARLLPDMYGPIGSFSSESKIFVVDADGSNEQQITDIPPEETFSISQSPDWSPDGQWIAFSNVNGMAGPGPLDSSLYIVKPDGSELTWLADSAGDARPLWSPTGDSIVYEKQPGGSSDFGGRLLRYIDLEEREPIMIAGGDRADPGAPAWSPNGASLVYWRHAERFSEETELVRYDPATMESTMIAHFGRQPAWSPDGETLAVVAVGGIVLMSLDGSDPFLIHAGGFSPQWQPGP